MFRVSFEGAQSLDVCLARPEEGVGSSPVCPSLRHSWTQMLGGEYAGICEYVRSVASPEPGEALWLSSCLRCNPETLGTCCVLHLEHSSLETLFFFA